MGAVIAFVRMPHAQEFTDALNQYDALVAAVQAKQSLMDHIVFCTTCGTGAMCDDYHPLYIDEPAVHRRGSKARRSSQADTGGGVMGIKTPVGICKRGSGRLHSDVLDAEGNYVAHEIKTEHAQEIVAILNQHDALLAERDELQAQRDALVKACEMWMRWVSGGPAPREIGIEATRAALALVRREDDDG
jgi:hypothetical protein